MRENSAEILRGFVVTDSARSCEHPQLMRDCFGVFLRGLAEDEVGHLVNRVMVIDIGFDAFAVCGFVGRVDDEFCYRS